MLRQTETPPYARRLRYITEEELEQRLSEQSGKINFFWIIFLTLLAGICL